MKTESEIRQEKRRLEYLIAGERYQSETTAIWQGALDALNWMLADAKSTVVGVGVPTE